MSKKFLVGLLGALAFTLAGGALSGDAYAKGKCKNKVCEEKCFSDRDCGRGGKCKHKECEYKCFSDRDCGKGGKCRAKQCEYKCFSDRDC